MNHWRKSSHSGQGTNCLELAADLHHIRDSKNPDGPTLGADLIPLIAAIKSGNVTG
jgi:hypothetical protein